MSVLLSYEYFPNIAWMSSFANSDSVLIEHWENFVRQSYRSRCYINGANGPLALIVPLQGSRKKMLMKDVQIDNSVNWKHQHHRSIISAYGNAPFYQHYQAHIHQFFSKDYTYLQELCEASLTVCLDMLGIFKKWQHSEKYRESHTMDIIDLRMTFSPKNREDVPDFFQSRPYLQVFGKQFVQNLSILDLIFCEGPNSNVHLSKSVDKDFFV